MKGGFERDMAAAAGDDGGLTVYGDADDIGAGGRFSAYLNAVGVDVGIRFCCIPRSC
jgi:hypothetical protein